MPKSHSRDTASSKVIANFKRPKGDFKYFVNLPWEIQNRVWEMMAEEPRIVAVNTETNSGLRSSRAVGLKSYTLAIESKQAAQPPRVYFNFERDTLYFRENWNKDVAGAWSCISRLANLVNEGDLKRVKRVGLDVNARVCSLKTSGESCHFPNFAYWDALETMYLGYEGARLGTDCPIRFGELESKDYENFIQKYKKNPCWRNGEWLAQGVEAAVEHLRNEVPQMYHGFWKKPDSFLGKLALVSVKHL